MTAIDISQLPEQEPVAGFHVRFVHSDNMTFAYWNVDAGAALPEHAHPHEQVVNVIEGRFELTVAGEALQLTAGSVVVLPSNVPHSGRAVSDCRLIDVFHPVREDYR